MAWKQDKIQKLLELLKQARSNEELQKWGFVNGLKRETIGDWLAELHHFGLIERQGEKWKVKA